MPTHARIRLWSTNVNDLTYVVTQIKEIAQKTGVQLRVG